MSSTCTLYFNFFVQITKIFFLGAPRPSEGELWYLWLLLKKGFTPRSYNDLLMNDGISHDTYKDTAFAAGLLDDPLLNEASYALQEAVDSYASPRNLRRLFILLVRSDFPVGVAFDSFFPNMIDDNWKVAKPFSYCPEDQITPGASTVSRL